MFDAFEMNVFKWNLNGNNPLDIWFVGDNHDDVDAHVDDHLEDVKKRAAKRPREASLFYLMGDYGDFASTSERAAIKAGKLHETTVQRLDDLAQKDLEKRVKQFEFMRGRIISCLSGNHDWVFASGDHASERMAEMLGCHHGGYVCYSRVKVAGIVKSGGAKSYVDIFASHGKSGGTLLGSPWNSLERMSKVFHDADVFAMGHDHSKGVLPDTRLYVEENKRTGELELKEKVRCFVRTGSALRGYEAGKKSYVSRGLYKPCSLGFPRVEVNWRRVFDGGIDRIVKELHSWS